MTDDQAARERELRRRARNEQRASKGKPTWDADWDLDERWPIAVELSEQPTMIISPQQLRQHVPPPRERDRRRAEPSAAGWGS